MDGYNIKIGVDSRSAERGVRSFSSSLNDSLKALRTFDDKARSAFKALDQFSKLNGANLSRSVGSISGAIERLNRIKVSRGLVNNLQTLQKTLSGIRFTGGDSLAKLPAALKALENIKINSKLISDLNSLKSAIKGFSSPPKSLAAWPKALSGMGKITITPGLAKQLEALKGALKGFTSPSKNLSRWAPALSGMAAVRLNGALPRQLTAMKTAMRGFGGPSKGALALPKFLAALSKVSINPGLASGIARLKTAVTGFPTISARAGANLVSLFTALRSMNPSDINRIAASLMKLNGLNININARGLGNLRSGLDGASGSMARLGDQTNLAAAAMGVLQAAVGGMSIVGFAKSIYETGVAWQSLQRTLGSVATSNDEVGNHLQFILDLTTRMPISIEAATESFRKFSVAARLSGLSVADTQETFENFSTGFSAMGLTTDAQKYAFIALEQMLSKGQVQMEELKTQLGDHLPGAVQLMARALDVPTAKLMKMIEAGEVGADAVVKMGKVVKEQFGSAAEAAVNSTQGQFVKLGNAWTMFKKTIFDSGFDAALGAMAKSLSDILNSDRAVAFARSIGDAFKRAFEAIAVGAQVLADNKETVIAFFKAFVAASAITAAANAMRLLSSPVLLTAAAFALLTSGSKEAGIALVALGGLQILKAVASIGSALSSLSSKVMAVTAGVVLLAAGLDAIFNDGRAVSAMAGGLKSVVDYMGNAFGSFGEKMGGGLGGVYEEASRAAQKFQADQEAIANNNYDFSKQQAKNAADEARAAAQRAVTLSKEAEKLWEQINPIGKANEEYQKQLNLLDEIAKKRGLSPEQKDGFRRVLDANSLEDRSPIGASIKGMREELASLQAKTAEQKAFNAAKEWEQDMLAKGVVMTADEWKNAKAAVADYSLAVAKMNGEVGNGIDRWVAKVGDFNSQVQDAISDGISGLSDELTDLLSGAEADFAGLARSILKSFIKISLDGIMKDMFTSMGFNPMKSGQSDADAALAKLGQIGENITTAQTNVYTNGLTINGETIGSGDTAGAGLFKETPLRGPLDGNGTSNANLTPNQLAAKMGLRGTFTQTHDFSKTQAGVDRNPSFDPDALDKKFALMEQEGRRIEQGLPDTIGTGAKTLALSNQEITDLKKTLMTEWVPGQGEAQGKGIIDTILNRKASGKWGESVTDVVNADRQFSGINGKPAWDTGRNSVDDISDNMLTSGKGKMSADLVDKYLAQRAAGVGSSVGDNLNYANPAESDAANRAWIDKLDGPQLGAHKHGTTADLQKFRPGEFGVQLPGQQAAGSMPTTALGGTGTYKEVGNFVARGADKVDPELRSMLEEAAKRSGLQVEAYSGFREKTGKNGGTGLHTQGLATDVSLRDPVTGKVFGTGNGGGHYQTAEGFRQNERFAQTVKGVADERGMGDDLRWGGYFSSKDGPKGYGALDGMHYDLGGRQGRGMAGGSWENGLNPSMRAAYPGIQSVGLAQGSQPLGGGAQAGLDPMVTQSITSANAALKETGNALNQAMPGFQTLETNVQKTGTAAMTSGQQLQQAEQMKMVGEQQQVMSTQQAGIAMQSAGTSALSASPQFQQAGAAIAQAGAAAGQGAQAAAAGASGGLGQLGSLLGMIPGMGQYGGLLSSFLGMFSEGGYATSPVSKMRVPHYAEGTANTSGGIPSVLHPNEAVIPLSRGRKVPVEIDSTNPEGYKSEYGQSNSNGPTIVNLNLHGVKDGDSFKRSKRQAQSMMASAMQRNAQRDQ